MIEDIDMFHAIEDVGAGIGVQGSTSLQELEFVSDVLNTVG